jgi:hypothetical protein
MQDVLALLTEDFCPQICRSTLYGGGVEYLHCSRGSWRRRRKGNRCKGSSVTGELKFKDLTPQIWGVERKAENFCCVKKKKKSWHKEGYGSKGDILPMMMKLLGHLFFKKLR